MLTKALVGVCVIGVLLAAFMIRERLRLRALEAAAREQGLALHLPFPADRASVADPLALHLDARARGSSGIWSPRWGVALTGRVAGHDVTIADHQVASGSASSTRRIWYTMVFWPVPPGARPAAPARDWPHGGDLACLDGWAAWRVEGELDVHLLGRVLRHAPEAMRAAC